MSLTMQELPKNASAKAHTKSKHREWMTIRPVENRQYLELSQKRTVFFRILLKTFAQWTNCEVETYYSHLYSSSETRGQLAGKIECSW